MNARTEQSGRLEKQAFDFEWIDAILDEIEEASFDIQPASLESERHPANAVQAQGPPGLREINHNRPAWSKV